MSSNIMPNCRCVVTGIHLEIVSGINVFITFVFCVFLSKIREAGGQV